MLAGCGGKLDALVHNAGISAAGAVEDIPMEDIRRVLETNFLGPVALTRRLLPAFRAQGAGRIVLVSSEAAFFGQPANSIYCASKWALEGWGKSIAFELAPFGIDVVIVEPGPYRTEIWRSSLRFAPEGSPYRDFAARRVPLGRRARRRKWRAIRRRWPRRSRLRLPRSARASAIRSGRSPSSGICCAARSPRG